MFRLKNWQYYIISIFVLVIDNLTKSGIVQHMKAYESVNILPFMNFTLVFNSGTAFSIFEQLGRSHPAFLSGFSAIISAVLVFWIASIPHKDKLQLWGFSLILGGALGNLSDRIRYDVVIDFIDLYYKTHHWPVFNLADVAVCLGAGLVIADYYRHRHVRSSHQRI